MVATDEAVAGGGGRNVAPWSGSSDGAEGNAQPPLSVRRETRHGSANPTRSVPGSHAYSDEGITPIDHRTSRRAPLTHPVPPHDTVSHPILPPHIPDDLPEALVPRTAVLALHPDLEHLDLAD
jgi:hypothetical protein